MRSETGNWSNAGFHAVQGREDYQRLENEYMNQRTYNYPGSKQYPNDKQWLAFNKTLTAHLEPFVSPTPPSTEGFQSLELKTMKPTLCGAHEVVLICFCPVLMFGSGSLFERRW